uniref:TraX family protein n=1 Tax=Streptococcus pluranimalium TaxID=82348 RepID=UPI003F693206
MFTSISKQIATFSKRPLDKERLKWLAIVAMTINHIGHIFSDVFNPFWWEFTYLLIGLITFPIMARNIVEGYHYTKDIKQYLTRLFIFAFISILPYHFAFDSSKNLYFLNNVFFTLLIGLICLWVKDHIKDKAVVVIILSVLILFSLESDWGGLGVLMILMFDIKRDNTSFDITLGVMSIIYALLLLLSDQPVSHSLQYLIGFRLPVIAYKGYSDQEGVTTTPRLSKHSLVNRYFFYLYYPLHLTILVILHALIVY